VALVTGANRGFGRAITQQLLDRGARKVYAGVRDPGALAVPGLTPLKLDITNPDDVAAAARVASDVTLLVNNAGINTGRSLMEPDALARARADFETNVLGTAGMSRSFAPVLAANGGGAILNILSALSFVSLPRSAGYAASKAALWSLTNALRLELLEQGTQVIALHVGLMATDMTAGLNLPKSDPADIAAAALDGVEARAMEVLADEASRALKRGLSADLSVLYPSLARPGS